MGTTGNTPSLDHEQIILLKAVDRDHTCTNCMTFISVIAPWKEKVYSSQTPMVPEIHTWVWNPSPEHPASKSCKEHLTGIKLLTTFWDRLRNIRIELLVSVRLKGRLSKCTQLLQESFEHALYPKIWNTFLGLMIRDYTCLKDPVHTHPTP